jgi:cytochrome c oxidase subunit IV
MKEVTDDNHTTKRVTTKTSYLQRALQATLTIWLSLIVVSIVVFGLSESLRLAGVERNQNLLITFIVALGLILLALWLVPRSFLTFKEEQKDDVRQRYVQHVLQSLAVIWATMAVVLLGAIALYGALSRAGVERNQDLLITFIIALGLILLALWLVPRSFLMLKEA